MRSDEYELRYYNEIIEREVSWLWFPYIPNLNMLLRLYLKESSVFGVTADIHAMCVDNIQSELEKAERDLIEKNSVPAEELFDSIYKELGLPIPEKDPEE